MQPLAKSVDDTAMADLAAADTAGVDKYVETFVVRSGRC
jgi:hypothetical protein